MSSGLIFLFVTGQLLRLHRVCFIYSPNNQKKHKICAVAFENAEPVRSHYSKCFVFSNPRKLVLLVYLFVLSKSIGAISKKRREPSSSRSGSSIVRALSMTQFHEEFPDARKEHFRLALMVAHMYNRYPYDIHKIC